MLSLPPSCIGDPGSTGVPASIKTRSFCHIKRVLYIAYIFSGFFWLDDFTAYSHASNSSLLVYACLFRVQVSTIIDRNSHDATNSVISWQQVDTRLLLETWLLLEVLV